MIWICIISWYRYFFGFKKLVLSIGEFRGEDRIDLRTYVQTEKGYIATKAEVNMHAEHLEALVELIMKLNKT